MNDAFIIFSCIVIEYVNTSLLSRNEKKKKTDLRNPDLKLTGFPAAFPRMQNVAALR